MRVLIVGAGLGGLCLAHGLRQAGVDVQVLERRPSPHRPARQLRHPPQRRRSAARCTPASRGELAPARRRGRPRPATSSGSSTSSSTSWPCSTTNPPDPDPVTRRRAVSRDALRDALLLGLTDSRRRRPVGPASQLRPPPRTASVSVHLRRRQPADRRPARRRRRQQLPRPRAAPARPAPAGTRHPQHRRPRAR